MHTAPPPPGPASSAQIRVEEPERLAAVAAICVLLAVAIAQAGDLLTFLRMVSVAGIGEGLIRDEGAGAGAGLDEYLDAGLR